jgi:hypothetical protein
VGKRCRGNFVEILGAPAGRRFCREIRGELSRVTPRRNLTQAIFLPLSDPGKLAQASDRLHRRYCPQASVRPQEDSYQFRHWSGFMPFLISQRTDDDAPLGATASTRPSNVMNVDGPLCATSGRSSATRVRALLIPIAATGM